MKSIILLISITCSSNLFAINLAAECNNCNSNQEREKAMQYSSAIPHYGFIYVFNFTNHHLKKYFVWQEDLLNSNDINPEV